MVAASTARWVRPSGTGSDTHDLALATAELFPLGEYRWRVEQRTHHSTEAWTKVLMEEGK